jgi:ABC-type Fe3+ transport system substrate-binding protein
MSLRTAGAPPLGVSGEVPLALTLYHYKAEQMKNAGAPLDWYVLPPGVARFLGTGVMRRAPHPHAAVLFMDFMLYEAQKVLVDRDFTPTNMKVKPLDVPFVDHPAQVLDQNNSASLRRDRDRWEVTASDRGESGRFMSSRVRLLATAALLGLAT